MLKDLSYTTHVMNGFGHQIAFIRSPHSSNEAIWSVSTSIAPGGKRKHADLIHTLARRFIVEIADARLIDNLERYFSDGNPAIFTYFDGGEDPSEEPTKIVCLDPNSWRLQGAVAGPWVIAYDGIVFHLEDDHPMPLTNYTPFWIAEWMEQISIGQLAEEHPEIASKLSQMFEGRDFSPVLLDPVVP